MLLIFNYIVKMVGDAGLSEAFYSGCNNAALVVAAVFYVWYARKYKIHWIKAYISTAVVCLLTGQAASLIVQLEAMLGGSKSANFVLGFVYAPMACWLIAKILRIQTRVVCDYQATMPLMLHGIYRIGCTFAGCCHGFPTIWGIYNPYLKEYQFPVQLLEAIISFSIIGYLLHRAKKKCYVADGKAFPIMLALYGGARFVTEFLHDNKKILLGCSSMSFHALFMCAVGIVALVTINARDNKKVKTATT